MPRKRRIGKARIDQSGELAAWRETFRYGVDFFGELAAVGIPWASDRPTNAEIEAAWRRLGAAFIAAYGSVEQHGRPLWALLEFGEP